MTIRSSRINTFAHASFRLAVVLFAGVLALWIVALGLNAIVANPYLIVVVWLMGLLGLFACVGACINTFPAPGEDHTVPRPGRALLCLMGGTLIGSVLWLQARPAMEGEPLGMKVAGMVLAGTVVLGLALMVFMSLVLLSAEEEGEGRLFLGAKDESWVNVSG